MPDPSDREPSARFRRISKYLWILPGVAFLCVAWIFFLRWQENRQIEQQAIQKKRAEDRQSVEMLGGDRFEILQFYAAPGFIRRGESAQLCYGVSQAKSVRLEPQSPPVWPSFSRCVYVAPVRDTTYTLTAEDAEGRRKTATVIVHVR